MVHNVRRPIALIMAILLCLGLCSAMVLPASAAGEASAAPAIDQRYYWDPDVTGDAGATVSYKIYVKNGESYQEETHPFKVYTSKGTAGDYGVYKNLEDIPANEDGVKQIFMFAKKYTFGAPGAAVENKKLRLTAFEGGCTYEFYGMKFDESPIVPDEDGLPSSQRKATRTDDAQETILDGHFVLNIHLNVTLNGIAIIGENRSYLRDESTGAVKEVNELNVINCISSNESNFAFMDGGYGVLSIVNNSNNPGAQHTGEFSHNHLIVDRDKNSSAATGPTAGFLLLNGIGAEGFTVSDNYCENTMGVASGVGSDKSSTGDATGYFAIRLNDRSDAAKPFNLTMEGNTFVNVAAIHNNGYKSTGVGSVINVTNNKFEVNKNLRGTPTAFSMMSAFASDKTAQINISGNVFSGYTKHFTNCTQDEYPDNVYYNTNGQLISGESKTGKVSKVKLDNAGHLAGDFDLTLYNGDPLTVNSTAPLSLVNLVMSAPVLYEDIDGVTADTLVTADNADKVQVKVYTDAACTELAEGPIEINKVYYAKVTYRDETTPLYAVYTIVTGGTDYTDPELYWDPAVAGKSNGDKVPYIIYEGENKDEPKAYLFTVGENVFATVEALKDKDTGDNVYDVHMFAKVYQSADPNLSTIGKTGDTYKFYGAKSGVSPIQADDDGLPSAERAAARSDDAYETILELKSATSWQWTNAALNVTMDGVAFAGLSNGFLRSNSQNPGGGQHETIEMLNCMTVNGNVEGGGYTTDYTLGNGSGYGFVSLIRNTPHKLVFQNNYLVTSGKVPPTAVISQAAYMVAVRSVEDVEISNNYYHTDRMNGGDRDAAVMLYVDHDSTNGGVSSTYKANIHDNTLNAEIFAYSISSTNGTYSKTTINDATLTVEHNKIDLPDCPATRGVYIFTGTAAADSTYKISITENIFTAAARSAKHCPIQLGSGVNLSAATGTFEIKGNTFDNTNGAFQYPVLIEGTAAKLASGQLAEVTGNTLINFANGWSLNKLSATSVDVAKNLYLTTKYDKKVVTSVGDGSGFEAPTTYYIDAAGKTTTKELAVSNKDAQVGSFKNGMQNISMNLMYKCTPESFTVSEENKIVGVYTDPDLTTPLEEITYEESENTTVYVLVARRDDSIAVINKIDVTLTPCKHVWSDAPTEHKTPSTCTTHGIDVYTCTVCGETDEREAPTVPHEYTGDANADAEGYTVDKEPNCADAGSKSKHCKWYDECGRSIDETPIPSTGEHNFVGTVKKAASCTETGVMHYECDGCGNQFDTEIPMTEHHYQAKVTTPATCDHDGVMTYTCTACGDTYDETIDKYDSHDWGEWEVVEQSTCVKQGTHRHTCRRCGETETEPMPLIDHIYGTKYYVAVQRTGTQEGFKCHHCLICGQAEPREQWESTGFCPHEPSTGETFTKPATCTEKGEIYEVCAECGDHIHQEYIEMIPHDYKITDVEIEASCTEAGLANVECSVCGEKTTQEIAATGHVKGPWTVTEKPTCTDKGVEKRFCKNCKEELETRDVAATGHVSSSWVVVESATCLEGGVMEYRCDACGVSSGSKTVPATGHIERFTDITAPTCTTAGLREYTCTVCGNVRRVAAPATGHTLGKWSIVKEPTTLSTGLRTRTCTVCGEIVNSEVLEKLDSVDSAAGFIDVGTRDWFKSAVDFAVGNGLFEGTSQTTFDPQMKMTRGMLVTVLGRMSGADPDAYQVGYFEDVSDSAYYYGYVEWARQNGIVEGVSTYIFEPDRAITRQEMCKVMVDYADFAGIALKNMYPNRTFKDASKVSGWAKTFVNRCQHAGIVNGDDDGSFRPLDTSSRAEVATMLMNFYKNYII